MSKSKKNVIAPEAIIDVYGADTIRWFMLSDTPPERDIEWTDAGRRRLLALCPARLAAGGRSRRPGRRRARRPTRTMTISKTLAPGHAQGHRRGDGRSGALRFNRAVAQLYMLANAIADGDKADAVGAARGAGSAGAAVRADDAASGGKPAGRRWAITSWWRKRPGRNMIPPCSRPTPSPSRCRSTASAAAKSRWPQGADNKTVEEAALALDGVMRALDGSAPKKVIVVPNRIVNIVA